MAKDTQNNLYYFMISFSKENKSTQASYCEKWKRLPMQKKTTARHIGIWMVFFLTKYLIGFHDRKTRFTLIDFIAIWNNKIATFHFSEENSLLGEIIVLDAVFSTKTPCFLSDPVFATKSRVFRWDPVFFT